MNELEVDRFMEAALAEDGMPISAGLYVPPGGGPGLAGPRMHFKLTAARSPETVVRRTRQVQTDRFIVVVEVDAIISQVDPAQEKVGPDGIALLREVELKARAGDVEWLRRHGKVYQALDIA